MREFEPRAQVTRGLVRGGSIERHHRRRHSGRADDLGPPAVAADRRDLDVVQPTANGLVEPLSCGIATGKWHGSVQAPHRAKGKRRPFFCSALYSTSEGTDEATVHRLWMARTLPKSEEIFSSRQAFHSACTVYPQVFHSRPGPRLDAGDMTPNTRT